MRSSFFDLYPLRQSRHGLLRRIMIWLVVPALLLLKSANGQSPSVSMIPQTGSYPTQGETLILNCYQNPGCVLPLQWYYWNTSDVENAIWTAGNTTSLARSKGVQGYCSNLYSNCNLTMIADKEQDDGPWYCLCLGVNASIVVYITDADTNTPLTVGEIVGIAFGCLAVIAIVIIVIIWILICLVSTDVLFVLTIAPGEEKGVTVKVKCVESTEPAMKPGDVKITRPDRSQSEVFVLEGSGPDGKKNGIVVVEGTWPDGKKGTAMVVKTASGQTDFSALTNGSKLNVIGARIDWKKVNALVVGLTWPDKKGNGHMVKGNAVVVKENE